MEIKMEMELPRPAELKCCSNLQNQLEWNNRNRGGYEFYFGYGFRGAGILLVLRQQQVIGLGEEQPPSPKKKTTTILQ